MKKKKIQIKEIVDFIGDDLLELIGHYSCDDYIDNISDFDNVNATSLDWINPAKANKLKIAENSLAKFILTNKDLCYAEPIKDKVILVVENPRLQLANIINAFYIENKPGVIHTSVILHPEAVIDKSVTIDAGSVIGRVKIGKNSVIKSNVSIFDDVEIGDNCLIQAGSVIGTDGLGCHRDGDGCLHKFPHIGGVKIGNNVEIGANCQIARGALSNTIIKNGCKINGMCFIAHNCILEENVWITGSTMLSGSIRVGKNTTIFSKVVVREQCKIGENVKIGMGSVVTKNIPDGETWFGNPARKKE